jgi:hypothetical protein
MTYYRIIGFDPNGICRVLASTLIEARQEARNYIRKQADTAPLAAWRFEFRVDTPGMRSAGGLRSFGESPARGQEFPALELG